jgi:uncharacterized protein YecE (DUF72 family)
VIRVGPAGWSYADWEGVVYPRRKPRGFHPLAYLARSLDALEINSSFYALPRSEHCQRWVELVEHQPEFRFCAKLHQDFTHGEASVESLQREVGEFLAGVKPLRLSGKLAALLAQFPITFRFEPSAVKRLESLCANFTAAPLVLELRHRSWFEHAPLQLIERLPCSLAAIDLPAARDHPPADHPTPGPLGYLRLHGRNQTHWFGGTRDQRYDYLYSPEEIEALSARARRIASGHDDTFVITNNHFEGKAVANALELTAALRGTRLATPEPLLSRYPRLAAIALPQSQRELF